jgi:hypothetical protein
LLMKLFCSRNRQSSDAFNTCCAAMIQLRAGLTCVMVAAVIGGQGEAAMAAAAATGSSMVASAASAMMGRSSGATAAAGAGAAGAAAGGPAGFSGALASPGDLVLLQGLLLQLWGPLQ